jgi:hypothetical protein
MTLIFLILLIILLIIMYESNMDFFSNMIMNKHLIFSLITILLIIKKIAINFY